MNQTLSLISIFPNLDERYVVNLVSVLDTAVLLLLALHLFFSAIMLKQVIILDRTLTTRANDYIKALSILHFLASFCLLVFSAVTLFII